MVLHRSTGLVFHERYLWHDTGSAAVFVTGSASRWVEPDAHIESPGAKRRVRNLLEVSGLLAHLEAVAARTATREELERVHTPDYLDRLQAMSDAGHGDAGVTTPVGPGSYEIAALSAGGVCAAVEAVADGRVKNAYALVRPPGHHAEPSRGMGFCLLSNIGIAIRHAQATGRARRIAVVDWDVHHGNGTETIFYDDPSVLTVSLHQDRNFPSNRGLLEHNGKGAGVGANLNVPLPPGCGVGAYEAAMERVVVPAVRRFAPDMIVVASGYDGGLLDPMGRMMLHSGAFRTFAAAVLGLAGELCHDRLVVVHEGGYSAAHVPFCALAVIETMSGIGTDVDDPFLAYAQRYGQQELQPHQDAQIAKAETLIAGVPTPPS